MKKIVVILVLAFAVCTSFCACSEDDVDTGKSVIREPEIRDTPFDRWIYRNYTLAYNVDFQYWIDDGEMDPGYNLVPAEAAKSKEMGMILKYLFFETYDEVTGTVHFMRDNAPRLICLVGSMAIDPESGAAVLGTAEGGTKILLYDVNQLAPTNIEVLSSGYLHTIHHEFAHILHQKKSYPQEEFNSISAGLYTDNGWRILRQQEAWNRGCVTSYACSKPREDFVEVLSMYLTTTDAWWDNMMAKANDFGRNALTQKLSIVTSWLQNQWNIDIKELQTVYRRRTTELPGVLEGIDY